MGVIPCDGVQLAKRALALERFLSVWNPECEGVSRQMQLGDLVESAEKGDQVESAEKGDPGEYNSPTGTQSRELSITSPVLYH